MRSETFNLIGWILFILSASSFIISSLKSGDMWGLAGSVIFFIACFVFLIPYFRRGGE